MEAILKYFVETRLILAGTSRDSRSVATLRRKEVKIIILKEILFLTLKRPIRCNIIYILYY